jgi:Pyruvate/2-oxoacid:ferredoxin oxidoreductase gamma subunit
VHRVPTIQPPAGDPVRPAALPQAIKAAGFGGQGILLLGELLAKCGLSEGLSVTWLPSYGPEMRGGTANCSVVIADGAVGNPLVEHPTLLIAMNRPSLERFEADLEPDGVVVYDSSLIDIGPTRSDVRSFAIDATGIADQLGNNRFANVVMLGAVMELLGFPAESRRDKLLTAISKTEAILEGNRQALAAGIDAMRTRLTP